MGTLFALIGAVNFHPSSVRIPVFDRSEFLLRFDEAAAKLRFRRVAKSDDSIIYESKAPIRTNAVRAFVTLGPDEAVATGPHSILKQLKTAVEKSGMA
jgi:hypothetical protein